MENNEMTPEKSIQIISEAIEKCRKDIEKNAGTPLIVWGVIVVIFTIIVWSFLKKTGIPQWNFLWFGVLIVGWPIQSIITKKKFSPAGNSFISKLLEHIWIAYGIFATTLSAAFAFISPNYCAYITTVMLGLTSTTTGLVLKNNFITAGGYITGIGCTIGLFFIQGYDATLLFGVAGLLNLIIPGIMMNKKAN